MTSSCLPGAPHLCLFMSENMSLAKWQRLGLLEREMALYRRLQPRLGGVTVVSYGGWQDHWIALRYPCISVICNRNSKSSASVVSICPLLFALS